MSDPQFNGVNLSRYPLIENPLAPQQEAFEEEEELDLRQISKIIRRRGWLMALVGVGVSLLVGYKLMQRPPIYQEKFQLQVQPPGTDLANPLAGAQSLISGLNLGRDVSYYDTQIEILLSSKLLSPIVNQVNKEYFKDPANKDFFQSGNPEKEFDLEYLLEQLKINRAKETQVLEISFQDKDPNLVQFILEKLSKAYLNYTLEDQTNKSRQQLSFVDKQIPAIKQRLANLQKELQNFRLKSNFVEPQAQGRIISESLIELNRGKQENEAALNQAIALYSNLRQQLGINETQAIALNALTESSRYMGLLNQLREIDSKLAAASTQYTDESPIIQQLKAERDNLLPLIKQEASIALKGLPVDTEQFSQDFVSPNSIRSSLVQQLLAANNQLRQMQARQQSLTATEQQMRQEIQKFANSSGRYAELTGEIEIATQSLKSLMEARQLLEVEAARQFIPWKLISEIRTPEKPTSQLVRNLLLALLAGIVSGVAVGLLAESLDRSFHTPEELAEETGVAVLGTIPFQPQMPRFQNKKQKPFEQPPANWAGFLEAFSFLYTNLFFIREKKSCRSLVITSAIPGDGKSTNAFYLAQAAANMGQKVLLVDGDRYFPQQERWSLLAKIHGQNVEPIQLEADKKERANQIIPVPMAENLYVVQAAGKWFNPSELVNSRSLAMFIQKWEAEFDLILVDSPPILGVSDTKLLANQTDGVLLVVRLDKTSRELVKEVLLELKISNIPLLGLVANGAKHAGRKDYYYYNYYRKARTTQRSL
ncbi:MAG: AAA family ATPase [Snowella sp.]|nr:AAA family ATPase [Snowella sp.]